MVTISVRAGGDAVLRPRTYRDLHSGHRKSSLVVCSISRDITQGLDHFRFRIDAMIRLVLDFGG